MAPAAELTVKKCRQEYARQSRQQPSSTCCSILLASGVPQRALSSREFCIVYIPNGHETPLGASCAAQRLVLLLPPPLSRSELQVELVGDYEQRLDEILGIDLRERSRASRACCMRAVTLRMASATCSMAHLTPHTRTGRVPSS